MPHPRVLPSPLLPLALCAVAVAVAGVGAARAAPEVAPSPPRASFPPPESVLPTNALLVFDGFTGTFTGEDVSFARPGVDDALPFDTAAADFEGNRLAFIVDPGDLTGVDLLVVEPRCTGCFTDEEAPSWAVGAVLDEEPPVFAAVGAGPPQVITAGTVDALGIHRALSHDVTAELPIVTDASGFVRLRSETDDGAVFVDAEAITSGTVGTARASFPPGARRDECFRVFAIDVAGNETQLPEPICAEVGEGCAQTGASGNALALALVAALRALSRRRRRR